MVMYLTHLFLSFLTEASKMSPLQNASSFFPFIMFTLAKKKMIMWIHMYWYLLKVVRMVKIIAII